MFDWWRTSIDFLAPYGGLLSLVGLVLSLWAALSARGAKVQIQDFQRTWLFDSNSAIYARRLKAISSRLSEINRDPAVDAIQIQNAFSSLRGLVVSYTPGSERNEIRLISRTILRRIRRLQKRSWFAATEPYADVALRGQIFEDLADLIEQVTALRAANRARGRR